MSIESQMESNGISICTCDSCDEREIRSKLFIEFARCEICLISFICFDLLFQFFLPFDEGKENANMSDHKYPHI